MSLGRYRLQGQQQKVGPGHLDRAAVVYVRQSSRQQVLEHSESTRLQYALAERAVALGWARSQVTVIDDDLGVSAATADSRKGFARLVTEVTMGRVGVVLGIEMSRLARTGRDWHQLLELCSLSGVLLADPDGVYDPGVYNDRLLLGLKGTMSEAELYLIRQRMLSGKLAKAERGELAIPLPIGYARRPSGEVILDPDEQARHVVGLVFSTFSKLGTLNGVLRYLVDQQVQLPVRVHSGPSKGEIEWRRPSRETLQIMLHNPVYAGYYAYGRRQVEPRRKVAGRPSTGRVVKDASEWLVLLPGRLPAYITAEQYEANVARMAANRQTAATPGAPRDGSALLSGLLRCGRCGGHRMTVRYHDGAGAARSPHGYTCAFYQVNYGTGGRCQHIAGPALDDWVTAQVLDAVAPAALEVSMTAAAQAEEERAMLDKLWRQRIERARYAARGRRGSCPR
jgi:DNA invertase Pin-like site-specific DNA recombinase